MIDARTLGSPCGGAGAKRLRGEYRRPPLRLRGPTTQKGYLALKHRFVRIAAAVLAAAFALAMAGCTAGSGVNSFTWFVENIPANLDPQIASAPEDVLACKNLYGGLVRLDAGGQPQPDLAERWTVSPDGLTYTFTLKPGLTYRASRGEQTDYAITAEDFVYAFQRMFSAETGSPYAVEFAAIEGGSAVLAGLAGPEALGVKASGDGTVVFTLSEPDDDFLRKLALPGAMPCDEGFFESTGGSYGLTEDTTLSSGSFYLYNWTSGGLFLRREASDGLVDSLRLVQNTGSAASAEDLILNERCTAALDDTDAPTQLRAVSYSDTTWCLLFNTEQPALGNALLRQALAAAASQASLPVDEGLYAPAEGLVPDGLAVGGIDYRAAAGDPSPTLNGAYTLYRAARQTISSSDLMGITVLVPAGAGLTQAVQAINSVWQQELSLFFSLEEVPQEDFDQRLADGDYTIALAPVTCTDGSVYSFLRSFGPDGLTGYADTSFETLLAQAAAAAGSETRCALLAQAERQLLSGCAVMPLFAQQKRLLLADGVEGLVFDPYGPVLDLTWTTKQS